MDAYLSYLPAVPLALVTACYLAHALVYLAGKVGPGFTYMTYGAAFFLFVVPVHVVLTVGAVWFLPGWFGFVEEIAILLITAGFSGIIAIASLRGAYQYLRVLRVNPKSERVALYSVARPLPPLTGSPVGRLEPLEVDEEGAVDLWGFAVLEPMVTTTSMGSSIQSRTTGHLPQGAIYQMVTAVNRYLARAGMEG